MKIVNCQMEGMDQRRRRGELRNTRNARKQDHIRVFESDVSSLITPAERAAKVSELVSRVKEGAVPIGGFISPGEREVAIEVSKIPRARIIKLAPWGLKTYKPVGATATRWLASGRTLVLTGFPDDETAECSRGNCLKNNEWVRRIATAERSPEM